MNEKAKQKIQKLLALANDASDEESMTALAKAQELMLAYQVTEDELFDHKQQQTNQGVIDEVLYSGRPQKWLYRLAAIIAQNFRVKFYYVRSSNIELRFVSLELRQTCKLRGSPSNMHEEVLRTMREVICGSQQSNEKENESGN